MSTEYHLREIRTELSRCHWIDLTAQQTHDLFSVETELLDYISQCGMDTGAREGACGILAKRLIGRGWPCGGDSDEVSRQFFTDLKAALDQRGIKHRLE